MIYAVSIIIFYAVSGVSVGINPIFIAVIAQFDLFIGKAASVMLEAHTHDPFGPAQMIARGLRTSEAASTSISVSMLRAEAYHLIARDGVPFYSIRATALEVVCAHFLLFITILAIASSFSRTAQLQTASARFTS